MQHAIAAFLAGIIAFLTGSPAAVPPLPHVSQGAAAASALVQDPPSAPASSASTQDPAPAGTTTILYRYLPAPADSDAVTPGVLATLLAQFENSLTGKVNAELAAATSSSRATAVLPQYVAANGNPINPFAAVNAIDRLSGVTISNSTIDTASIPDLSATYLPLSGGALTGALTGTSLTLSGALNVPTLTASSTSYDSFTATNSTTTNATSTTFFATTASSTNMYAEAANVGTFAASGPATLGGTLAVSGKTTLAYASTTGITAGYASTSALVASNSFTLGNMTGFLKATAGVVGTALINLASDVTGILPVGNGGTGWANIAANTLLTGNGTGAVSTTTIGNGLTLSGGVLSTSFGTTTANVWTALQQLGAGFLSLASSTIGDGTQAGGLTVWGGATTTGQAYFGSTVGVGGLLSSAKFAVAAAAVSVSDAYTDKGRIATLNGTTESSGSITIAQSACGSYTVTGLNGTVYQTVLGEDGKCWLASNLGTSHVATAYNDYQAYGSLYQWGRLADGHQLITWTSPTAGTPVNGTTGTLSGTDNPGTSLFILAPSSPNDWRSPQNNNLWGNANRTNNVCPAGWHVPSQAEWSTWATDAGVASCSANCLQAMYNTNLKLPAAGYRNAGSGALYYQTSSGNYWSSSVSGTYASNINWNSGNVYPASTSNRANGLTVRCIQGS